MHPDPKELRQFVKQSLIDKKRMEKISTHVNECEFCHDYCEDYRAMLDAEAASIHGQLSPRALSAIDRIHKNSIQGRIIELKRFDQPATKIYQLAADGEDKPKLNIENIATLYSDQPEIILKLMRDNLKKQEYIQLIANDDSLTSGVMVEIPDAGRSFLTDDWGKAPIDESLSDKILSMKWQIKMPSATFALTPFKYDPEAVEYQKDIILHTEKDDKIKVSFKGKTVGKQISISILQLEGDNEFGQVKMVVSQKDKIKTETLSGEKEILFTISDADDEIKIRLYRQ